MEMQYRKLMETDLDMFSGCGLINCRKKGRGTLSVLWLG